MHDYFELLHWSFFASALVIAVITKFLKRVIKLLPQNKWTKLIYSPRLIPALLGALIGLVPSVPAPEVVDTPGIGAMLYFATAGILSVWVYSLLQKLFEDVLPGELKHYIRSKLGLSSDHNDEEGIDDDTSG